MSKGFSRPVPHEEFIKQKYLSSREESDEKQKRKRLYKAATKWKKLRILDDDLDLKKMGTDELGSDDEMQYGTKEEKPVIAAVIDERPLHLKRKDMKSRWVTIEGPDVDTTQDSNDGVTQISTSSTSRESLSSRKLPVENKDDKDLSPPRNRPSSDRKPSSNLSRWESKNDISSSSSNKSDLSPPRLFRANEKADLSPPRRKRNDESDKKDLSPPRRRSDSKTISSSKREKRDPSPSRRHSEMNKDLNNDLSPPRRKSHHKHERTDGYSSKSSERESKHSESSKRRHGLCDAKSVREEANKAKDREKEMISSKDASVLGKGAKTIYRDETGKIRDLEKEREEARKKSEVDEEKNAKYKEWSMGLKQKEEQKTKAEDAIHEMSKPLARYEDDEDLDKLLREKEQEEDPMLEYMRKKKWKQKVKNANEKGEKILEKPKYNGPTPAPLNRYGIQPGYRWDGVDRSNGFERDYFARISEKTAIREEAYRWSTEDM